MTGPYPQQPGQPWQNPDGSWQQPQQPADPTAPTGGYDLYPQTGAWPEPNTAPPPVSAAPMPGAYPPPPGQPQPYGPTSAPPYGQPQPYGQPGFAPPGPPQAPQGGGNNKGWIFGGIAVGAVILLLVVGLIVLNGSGGNDPVDDTTTTQNDPADEPVDEPVDEPGSNGAYALVDDLCSTFEESAYDSVLGADGSPQHSTDDYGTTSYMTCNQSLSGSDYNLGSLSVTATLDPDPASLTSSFEIFVDSEESVWETTMEELPGFGERAMIDYNETISPMSYLIVQDGNLLLDVRISTTEDGFPSDELKEVVKEVATQVMTGLAA